MSLKRAAASMKSLEFISLVEPLKNDFKFSKLTLLCNTIFYFFSSFCNKLIEYFLCLSSGILSSFLSNDILSFSADALYLTSCFPCSSSAFSPLILNCFYLLFKCFFKRGI